MSEDKSNKTDRTLDFLRESFTHTRPDPTTKAPTLRRIPPANNPPRSK
jgi:hypothetical protein